MDPGPQAGLNGTLVHRYYDPTTGQFLTVDPLVDETGQAYGYTGDDPANESDPLGLYFGQGFLDSIRHHVAAGYDRASQLTDTGYDWANGQLNNIGCENGMGTGIFGSAFDCGTSEASSSCPVFSITFQEDMDRAKANYNRDFSRITRALNDGDITPEEFQQNLLDIMREFRQSEQYYKQIYGDDGGDGTPIDPGGIGFEGG